MSLHLRFGEAVSAENGSPMQRVWISLMGSPLIADLEFDECEASIYRDWNFSLVRQDAGDELESALFRYKAMVSAFRDDWRHRRVLAPDAWQHDVVQSLLMEGREDERWPQWKSGKFSSEYDDINMRSAYLWGHLLVWAEEVPEFEKELARLRMPKLRTSEIFLIDYLVEQVWEASPPGDAWRFFKALVEAEDLTIEDMARATQSFPEILDYPTSWWPSIVGAGGVSNERQTPSPLVELAQNEGFRAIAC